MPYTRPTTDIAKEGLFNILQNNLAFDELKVLDLFGGTGCISYELASRGAPDITIVEKDTKMYDFIKKTSEEQKVAYMVVAYLVIIAIYFITAAVTGMLLFSLFGVTRAAGFGM